MRKYTETIFEWVIKTIIFLMVMACIWAMASCRILKSHKAKNSNTLDSTHQVINKQHTGTKTDSTAHSDKKDSAGKQTWWNYEKETTKTIDWFFQDPVKRNYDTTTPPVMKRETTITRERGQQYIQESHHNSDILDVDLSKQDTSSASQSQTTHLQKGSTNQVHDRSVKSIPAWLIIATVLVCLIIVYLQLSPAQIGWILAIFKRKKNR